jgi:hypothetical protein
VEVKKYMALIVYWSTKESLENYGKRPGFRESFTFFRNKYNAVNNLHILFLTTVSLLFLHLPLLGNGSQQCPQLMPLLTGNCLTVV